MGDEITGYEPETVYEASVETGDRIYFMFYHGTRASHVQIKRSDVSDSGWLDYLLIPDVDLHYHAPNGVWILHIAKECNPTWLFKMGTERKKGLFYTPTIIRVSDKAVVQSVVHTTPYGGRHYDTLIMDDMPIAEHEETLAQKNYREMKAEANADKRWNEVLRKKEVKKKMYLQLIDVTIFNRETKHIDFHENVIAENNDEAYLLAVQSFGKYDPKVHVKRANCILGFNEIGDKVED